MRPADRSHRSSWGRVNPVSVSSASNTSPGLRVVRILAFWAAALVLMLVVGVVLPPSLGPLAWGAVGAAALFALIRVLFLRVDGLSVADVGLGWTSMSPVRFLAGLALVTQREPLYWRR
jgi:hypothetical protein